MKTTTDFIFPDAFKTEAEKYISYKRSLGFNFSIGDQRNLSYMLNYIYIHNHSDVTHLPKEVDDSFLSQLSESRPRTPHANQSFIHQYGLNLQLNGYNSYVIQTSSYNVLKILCHIFLPKRKSIVFLCLLIK